MRAYMSRHISASLRMCRVTKKSVSCGHYCWEESAGCSVASISLRVGRDTKKSMSCGGRVCMMWCRLHFALCGLGYEVIAPCRCAIVVMSFECVVSPPPLLRIWRAFMDSGYNYSADICKYLEKVQNDRMSEDTKDGQKIHRFNFR